MAESTPHHPLTIIGGGIGGLTLALCLDQVYNHRHDSGKKLEIHVYESTQAYTKEAGGAIGLYPNGLRVLRNISTGFTVSTDGEGDGCMKFNPSVPTLLSKVRAAGCPYIYRRWMRHDGTEVAVAREDELLPDSTTKEVTNDSLKDDSLKDDSLKEVAVIKTLGNSLDAAGKAADNRPRGGSFRFVNEMGKRLSRISMTSTSTTRSSDASSVGGIADTELLSLGIRRWKYQQVLYEACLEVGVVIHFGKRLASATSTDGGTKTLLTFKDGSTATTDLLIGADGINSKVRNYIANPTNDPEAAKRIEEYTPEYTGTTCLMGCANVERFRGIAFPSSVTTKCHACYYPTRVPDDENDEAEEKENGAKSGDDPRYEQVFQIYFPSPIERPDTWRTLTPEEAKEECRDLAKKLREDGWDEQFLKPLESESLTGVLRVGLRRRDPLDVWHVGGINAKECGKAVLLGDAAHPPVPYIGQGAMMAMEDAGSLSLVLARYCSLDSTSVPNYSSFNKAMAKYEELRVQRTKLVLGSSVQLGATQQKRAESKLYNAYREWSIKAQVWAYGTLPVMKPGAAFDYVERVEEVL